MTKKVIPRGKYILVKPDNVVLKENDAGLSMPANEEQEEKAQGIVEAFGDEVKGIKKNDRVVYGVLAGEVLKIKEGGKEVEYKLLHDDDVIAFVR